MKFARILKHLEFNLIIFQLGLVWARPYPCPNKVQSKGWNSSSEDDLDMPPPTVVECTANCCWEAALRLYDKPGTGVAQLLARGRPWHANAAVEPAPEGARVCRGRAYALPLVGRCPAAVGSHALPSRWMAGQVALTRLP